MEKSVFPREFEGKALEIFKKLKAEGKTRICGREFAKIFFRALPNLKGQRIVLRQLMMHLAMRGFLTLEDGDVVIKGD